MCVIRLISTKNDSDGLRMSPGLGYGRAQLLMYISNTTHYTYTMQIGTYGNMALQSRPTSQTGIGMQIASF